MKAWEIARKPKITVKTSDPATYVRALLRDSEEPLAIVVEGREGEKYAGFITRREAIQITSHYSSLKAKDISRQHPVGYMDDDIYDIYKKMLDGSVEAIPVLESRNSDKIVGVVTISDIIKALKNSGFKPAAETVAEVMTTEDLDLYITPSDERVNRVWSDLVFKGVPGKIVVKSREEPVPWGIVTPREFIETGRWFFHRESESGVKTVAKVKRIMLRGVPAATPETPISIAASVMVEHEYPVIPVVDENTGRIVGVLTVFDVARAYLEGAKPGRVKPVKKPAMPVETREEEKVVYATSSQILSQVAVERVRTESLTGITVRDIMRDELPAISVNDTVEHARKAMIRYKTSYLLVVDEQGRIVGVVSKWSMLRAIGTKGPIWKRRVYDRFFIDYVMDRDIPKVRPSSSIEDVALRMVRSRAEVAIVVDDDGSIVGFVTKDDLVNAYLNNMYGRARVENAMTPRKIGIVHPHHSLAHVVRKMESFYLDALTVYDGRSVIGVVSANRLPFVAYEDNLGRKTRRLVWVRKLVKGAAKIGRYVKITPLLAVDATTELPPNASVKPEDDLTIAIEKMIRHRVDGIPVVSRDGSVLGVITKTDVIRELARTAQIRIEREMPVTAKKEEANKG